MSKDLQNKIFNYEVIPPAGVWDKIAFALDESELSNEFPARLYGAEVIPPVSVWNKITASLDAQHEIANPVIRRIFPIFKYATAAVIIGFLAWGGIQLLNDKSGNKDVVKHDALQPVKENLTPSIDQTNNAAEEKIATANNPLIEDEARNDAALEASKNTFAKLDVPVRSRIKEIASGFSFASSISAANIPRIIPPDELNPVNSSNRYITLMTPEGNIIRMSKKLSGLVCCVAGEDEDKACKDQIKKWREIISCSPACHSAGSFMNMLDLVDALQDN